MRYQDPILLAEAAGTTDLLVNGRLRLVLSSGRQGFEPIFEHEHVDAREAGQHRLLRFLAGSRVTRSIPSARTIRRRPPPAPRSK